MAMMDNELVEVGDSVYDIINGKGSVVHTNENSIDVAFSSKRRITFKDGGYSSNVRRLYWHAPVVIPPAKDPAKWSAVQKIVNGVLDYIEGASS